MNALPQLVYILRMIPIHLRPAFLKTYKSSCSRLHWGDSKPRINYAQLALLKNLGCVGLPDLLNYYRASHLSRKINWNVHNFYQDWVSPEASFTSLHLNSLLWMLDCHISPEIRSHPLIGPTIQSFHKVCKHTTLSTIPGPLTSIRMNSNFPPKHASLISNRTLVTQSNFGPSLL